MPQFLLTNRARADLRDIARFTQMRWGMAQRDRYLRAFREKFRLLAERPGAGRPREDLGSGYRSILSGSHVAVYREVAGGIEVVRVLHVSMDVVHRLEE